ncbi:putative nepenthesin [Lupinus albus]|uniref:Putative nepenthesin n=1 Tax=Lupinus albus TaxID=3870 RepID=A0A6A4QFG4_LUPAL|nr:putative nepenthesin [Lupinus albus]
MVVEVGIGTFNNGAYKSYLLVMDTVSSDIWTQCEDCKLQPEGYCYPQKEEYFPNSKSKSYYAFKTPLTYSHEYESGTKSSALYAMETFTFPSTSSSTPHLKFPRIVFRCGIKNYNPRATDSSYPLAGVFGMGMGTWSFINQIETQSGRRFSYCFVHMHMRNPPPSYLRFGTNIKPPHNYKTINFHQFDGHSYMVNVVDLGVNREHLNINKRIFYSRDTNNEGFLVDWGASVSYLSKGAYDVVARKLDEHFKKFKGELWKENQDGWLCYSRIKGPQGYQLYVTPQDAYMRNTHPGSKETFCLATIETKIGLNIIGAFHQVNYKFIYNIKDKTLQFGREDCAKNS